MYRGIFIRSSRTRRDTYGGAIVITQTSVSEKLASSWYSLGKAAKTVLLVHESGIELLVLTLQRS